MINTVSFLELLMKMPCLVSRVIDIPAADGKINDGHAYFVIATRYCVYNLCTLYILQIIFLPLFLKLNIVGFFFFFFFFVGTTVCR